MVSFSSSLSVFSELDIWNYLLVIVYLSFTWNLSGSTVVSSSSSSSLLSYIP